jgi:uncharacterized protein
MEATVAVDDVFFATERYSIAPQPLGVTLDVSRLTGPGYALRVRFSASVCGPCMRCLKPASPQFDVESREVDTGGRGRDGDDEDLSSPYVVDEVLDLGAWVRDALITNLPATIVCAPDCPGLCPVCAADLSVVGAGHAHDPGPPDPRWAKLRELHLD